jgi:hypothetical protein
MNIITSARDLFYKKKLDRVYDEMERILERNLLDYKKARSLLLEYSKLVKDIEKDSTFNKSERGIWSSRLYEEYEPAYNRLKARINYLLLQ